MPRFPSGSHADSLLSARSKTSARRYCRRGGRSRARRSDFVRALKLRSVCATGASDILLSVVARPPRSVAATMSLSSSPPPGGSSTGPGSEYGPAYSSLPRALPLPSGVTNPTACASPCGIETWPGGARENVFGCVRRFLGRDPEVDPSTNEVRAAAPAQHRAGSRTARGGGRGRETIPSADAAAQDDRAMAGALEPAARPRSILRCAGAAR